MSPTKQGTWCNDEYGAYMSPLYNPQPLESPLEGALRERIAELAEIVKELSDKVDALIEAKA